MKKILIFLFFPISFIFCEEIKYLNLEESIKIAIENNLNVKVGEEKVIQSEIEKKDAFTLFLPKIFSSFSLTRLDEPNLIEIPSAGISFEATKQYLYNGAITFSQPLFTGGKLFYTYKQSEESLKKTNYEYQKLIQDICFNVKETYFSILKIEKSLEVAKELKKQAQEHLKDANLLFKNGLVTKLDILKTEVFLAEVEQKIIEVENALSVATTNFNFLLNQPISTRIQLEDILEEGKTEFSFDEWKELAFKNRPELKIYETLLKISDFNINLAKSDYFPQISLLANYQNEKGTQSSLEEWRESWNAVIALELNIWNWGSTKNKIEKNKLQKSQLEKEYQLLKNSIELDVKNNFLNVKSAEEKIKTAKKQIEEAEENLRLTNLLYKEGMTTTTEVLDAQTSLSQAKNNYFQALYEYKIAYSQLEKASGVLK